MCLNLLHDFYKERSQDRSSVIRSSELANITTKPVVVKGSIQLLLLSMIIKGRRCSIQNSHLRPNCKSILSLCETLQEILSHIGGGLLVQM